MHRDVKGNNILITKTGEVKLVRASVVAIVRLLTSLSSHRPISVWRRSVLPCRDTWLTMRWRAWRAGGAVCAAYLRLAHAALGPYPSVSPLWMSPEVIKGCAPLPASDIW